MGGEPPAAGTPFYDGGGAAGTSSATNNSQLDLAKCIPILLIGISLKPHPPYSPDIKEG